MLNKVILMGRLTVDPEIKVTASGMSVCSFSLAVQRDFAQQGKERQTDFINIVAFGSRAEFLAKYFSKGQLMAVCGRLQTRSWEDKEGKKHYATDVVADEIHFAGGKKEGNSETQANTYSGYESYAPAETPGFYPTPDDDDLPF